MYIEVVLIMGITGCASVALATSPSFVKLKLSQATYGNLWQTMANYGKLCMTTILWLSMANNCNPIEVIILPLIDILAYPVKII